MIANNNNILIKHKQQFYHHHITYLFLIIKLFSLITFLLANVIDCAIFGLIQFNFCGQPTIQN